VPPFRVFGIVARPQSLPPEVVLFWNKWPVQSIGSAKYRPYCFCDPALPLALASAVRFSFDRLLPTTVTLPVASSPRASPSSRVLPNNTYPTVATAESSHGLSLPSAHQEPEVHLRGLCLSRFVPSSGFGCPLDGFLPRIPRRFYFAPAALMGFTLRRFPLPRGFRYFSVRKNPPTVNPAFIPPPKRQTGPTGLGFWVRASRDCLAITQRFRPVTTGASLGFCPFRVYWRKPWLDFSSSPLSRLAHSADHSTSEPAPQSLNRPSPATCPTDTGGTNRPSQPSWGSCTCPLLTIRVAPCLGY